MSRRVLSKDGHLKLPVVVLLLEEKHLNFANARGMVVKSFSEKWVA